jgi:hypothetical protein
VTLAHAKSLRIYLFSIDNASRKSLGIAKDLGGCLGYRNLLFLFAQVNALRLFLEILLVIRF